MLEFPIEFFNPEIREGFFVDATMKTAWAAQMEVLAHISAVCENHNIQWYAAYGTLLGAIRHEGYVPWDDDIDIWVMREDYNKLLAEYLPRELPEGYIVKSVLNDIGYSQFHSCVFNGNGINVSQKWMEEFHGCPFSVFIDIFPLDYLPRDTGKLEEQKKLVSLAIQAAELADKIGTEIRTTGEIKETIENIESVIRYIQTNSRYSVDQRLLKDKEWTKLRIALLKCANQIAGMYTERDGEYLVQYGDYALAEPKTFQKAWFAETYSASFENLMFPIPCGYEELLQTIYNDYTIIHKKARYHDYPFYKPQLEYLRVALKEKERNALISNGRMEEACALDEVPKEWSEKVCGKKAVLYVTGFSLYIEYGEKALDKLEKNLKIFEDNSDEIMLWWMPSKQMRTMLGLISTVLQSRYDRLLSEYKRENWGICDESDELERAMNNCAAYYGEMNDIAEKMVANNKPVMIEQMVES